MPGQVGGARGGSAGVRDFQDVGLHRIGQDVRQHPHAAAGHAVRFAAFRPGREPGGGAVGVGVGPLVEPVQHHVRLHAGHRHAGAVGHVADAQRQFVVDPQAGVGHGAGVDHGDRVGKVGARLQQVRRAGLLLDRQPGDQHVRGRPAGPIAVGAADRRVVVDVPVETRRHAGDDLRDVAHRGGLAQSDRPDVVAAFVEREPGQLGRQAVRRRTAGHVGAVGGVGRQVRRRIVLENDVVGRRETDVDHVHHVFQRVSGVRESVAVVVVQQGRVFLGQDGRERRDGVPHVEIGIARAGQGGIFAPRAQQHRAVHRVVAHARLVVVAGIQKPHDLQRADVGGQVAQIALGIRYGAGGRIGIVVHVDRGVAEDRNPDRIAVGARAGRAVTRPPPHQAGRGHHFLRHEADAPVVVLAPPRRVEQADSDERAFVGREKAGSAVERHAERRADGVGGDRDGARARSRRHRHRDGGGVGVEQIDVGGIGRRARAHGREVVVVPLGFRPELEPAGFVVGPHVAGDQAALERLVAAHRRPGLHPAVDEVGLALVQIDRLLVDPVGVGVDFHAREVVVAHDVQGRRAEHLVRVGAGAGPLAHGGAVDQPVRADVAHADRLRDHFAWLDGIHGARHGDRLGHGNLVAAVVFDRHAVARHVDLVLQFHDGARIQHVVGNARRITVVRIRIAPHLAGHLRGRRDVRLVAVFPVVVVDDRMVRPHRHPDHGLHHVADVPGISIDGLQRDLHVVFRQWHEKRLQHVRRLRNRQSAQGQQRRRRRPHSDLSEVHGLENRSFPRVKTLHRQLEGG